MSKKSAGKGLSYECNSFSLVHSGKAIGSGEKAPVVNSFSIVKSGKKPA